MAVSAELLAAHEAAAPQVGGTSAGASVIQQCLVHRYKALCFRWPAPLAVENLTGSLKGSPCRFCLWIVLDCLHLDFAKAHLWLLAFSCSHLFHPDWFQLRLVARLCFVRALLSLCTCIFQFTENIPAFFPSLQVLCFFVSILFTCLALSSTVFQRLPSRVSPVLLGSQRDLTKTLTLANPG